MLQLLDLPDDILYDIFNSLEDFEEIEQTKSLKSLRLTCKCFSPLLDAQFFSRLFVRPDLNIPSLTNIALRKGRYVRYFNLDIREISPVGDAIEQNDQLLFALIQHLPNLREVVIASSCDWYLFMPQLIKAMELPQSVQRLCIREFPGSPVSTAEDEILPFTDNLVRTVIEASGSTLQSLVISTQSNMSVKTFNALRDKATCLETLILQDFLGRQCREALCENTPWACRSTLKHLSFLDCRGAHSGAVACGIGNRLWCTDLSQLEVCKSGDHDDIPSLPYELKISIPQIDKINYEHVFPWEMKLLGLLPAKEVMMSFVPRSVILDTIGGFLLPGLQRLIIYPNPRVKTDHTTLKEVCAQRKVELSMDGKPTVGCTCPYGMQ